MAKTTAKNKIMNNNNKILVGKIVAPQGIRGQVRIQTYCEKNTDLKDLHVFSDVFEYDKFHFVRVLKSNLIIAQIDNIVDRNAAEQLHGINLYVLRKDLPKLKQNEFYQADLLGFDVFDMNNVFLGKIDCFQNFGGGDIIQLDNGNMHSFKGAQIDIINKKIIVLG